MERDGSSSSLIVEDPILRSLMNDDMIINVKEIDRSWAYSLSEELNAFRLRQLSGIEFTICRVPPQIRRDKEKYYDPAMISIGPYHRGQKELQSMEVHKLRFLNDFLARNSNNGLEDYISMLREVEDKARKCYFDYIDLTSEEFVKMLLLDGCFIVEFFLKDIHQSKEDENRIRGGSWFGVRVCFDLILLENQIPFFVISMLFKLLVRGIEATNEQEKSTYDLGIAQIIASDFFPDSEVKVKNEDVPHLLGHLYILSLQQNYESASEANTKSSMLSFVKRGLAWLRIYKTLSSKPKHNSLKKLTNALKTKVPCASKLVEYGIKLRIKNNMNSELVSISFMDGVLEIPIIDIDEMKKYATFNLLAFEQCGLTSPQVLSSYFRFIDLLIDTSKDVEILEDCGILVSCLKSSEDTAFYFNQLNDYEVDIDDKDNNYLPVYEEINKFCNSKWHRYRAKLKRDYFSNPWSILSLIAAVNSHIFANFLYH